MFNKIVILVALSVANYGLATNLFLALEPTDGTLVKDPSRSAKITATLIGTSQSGNPEDKKVSFTLTSFTSDKQNQKTIVIPASVQHAQKINLLIEGTVTGKTGNSTCKHEVRLPVKDINRYMIWLRGGSTFSLNPYTCTIQVEELTK